MQHSKPSSPAARRPPPRSVSRVSTPLHSCAATQSSSYATLPTNRNLPSSAHAATRARMHATGGDVSLLRTTVCGTRPRAASMHTHVRSAQAFLPQCLPRQSPQHSLGHVSPVRPSRGYNGIVTGFL
eukprot:6164295-Pleurochrysis_carterae.AAC.1